MSSPNFIRVGAVAAILAWMLEAIQSILPSLIDDPKLWNMAIDSPYDYVLEGAFGASFAALLIALVALSRLHTGRGARSFGKLGRTGFYVAAIGCLCILMKELVIFGVGVTFGGPAVTDIIMVPGLLYVMGELAVFLGLILMAIAILRSRVLPRWFGWAIMIVQILSLALPLLLEFDAYANYPAVFAVDLL